MKFAAKLDTEIHLPNCYGVLNAYRKRPFTNSKWEKEFLVMLMEMVATLILSGAE